MRITHQKIIKGFVLSMFILLIALKLFGVIAWPWCVVGGLIALPYVAGCILVVIFVYSSLNNNP